MMTKYLDLNVWILYICIRLLFNLSAFVLVASCLVASRTKAETIIGQAV
jgi:hypothetical protein